MGAAGNIWGPPATLRVIIGTGGECVYGQVKDLEDLSRAFYAKSIGAVVPEIITIETAKNDLCRIHGIW